MKNGREIWRPVYTMPFYQVSNLGRVRRTGTERVLKPWTQTSGHLALRLRGVSKSVHHLVLESFVEPRPLGLECRHLDGNPKNNTLRNLAWGNRRDNISDYRKHHGRHMQSALTDEQRQTIQSRLTGKFGEQSRVARELGVHVNVVHKIAMQSGGRRNRLLTKSEVSAIRNFHAAGTSQNDIANAFLICQSAVSRIVRGLSWL